MRRRLVYLWLFLVATAGWFIGWRLPHWIVAFVHDPSDPTVWSAQFTAMILSPGVAVFGAVLALWLAAFAVQRYGPEDLREP